ncbi:hypothetical protein SNOUR_40825 [Streptomyces noursei ATCC 11455]|uniref:SCO4402 family protein n=1 Tax=Streptomyces noursei TaxID=1971 RepID=UPI00081C8F0D|nr:hypothetical protein SNOUR_40825 [Streptomyces noursei ATCC 11455]
MSEEEIRLPEMRAGVIAAVQALADGEYQRRVWIDRIYPTPGYFDDFTLTFNILEDAAILDDPYAAIGRTLASEGEATALSALSDRLVRIIQEVGAESPDGAFLASPSWNGVIEAARSALALMTR